MDPIIDPKLRHELKKVGQKITFMSGENMQRLLCKNKLKLLPNSNTTSWIVHAVESVMEN